MEQQYGSNIPPLQQSRDELQHPPSPSSSDDVKDAPVALVMNSKNGRQRHRLRCVPDDACEAFSVAVVVIIAILVTSIVMLLTDTGNQTVAYSWVGAILGMALIKMTKATARKHNEVVDV